MKEVELYQTIGYVFVWLMAGMGAAFVLHWGVVTIMNLFLRHVEQWKGWIQFIRYRKEFFEWCEFKKIKYKDSDDLN